jgi:hypothetical protein
MYLYCMVRHGMDNTYGINVFMMQIDYVKILCKENVQALQKKSNRICMKQLIGGKHMENDCFPRTLKLTLRCMCKATLRGALHYSCQSIKQKTLAI